MRHLRSVRVPASLRCGAESSLLIITGMCWLRIAKTAPALPVLRTSWVVDGNYQQLSKWSSIADGRGVEPEPIWFQCVGHGATLI